MEKDWSDYIDCKFTGVKLKEDRLNRAHYSEYLTNYLKNYKNESYVFNINSEWGAGKTYFIKRWANYLTLHHPVVYFDSWQHDNNSEPLILIVSEILEQLNKLLPNKCQQETKNELFSATFDFIKHVAPTLGKGIFQKISGVKWSDLAPSEADIPAEKNNNNSESKLFGEIGKSTVEGLLSLHKKQEDSIKEFKKNIQLILRDVLTDNGKHWSPMYIFIDELDRCRPTFAIEVLEVVKHIFDIPKIIFVIATDTGQLQHSIKSVYGNEFNAEKYLMRFFHRSFSLPKPRLEDYITTHRAYKKIKDRIIITSCFNYFEFTDANAHELIVMIFESLDIDLRTVDQILERLSSILENYSAEKAVIVLLVLETIRAKSVTAFELMTSGKITEDSGLKQPNTHEIFLPLITSPELSYKQKKHADLIHQEFMNVGAIQESFVVINASSIIYAINSFFRSTNKTNSQKPIYSYLLESIGENNLGVSKMRKYRDLVEIASHLS